MDEIIPLTIVPRFGQVRATLSALEASVHGSIQWAVPDLRREPDEAEALSASVPRGKLEKICKIIPLVDVIAVSSAEESALDGACRSWHYPEFNGRVYSPTAASHPGSMSGKRKGSDARYDGLILREEERSRGDGPVALLLQYLPAQAQTSLHYHKNTSEGILRVFGRAGIYMRKLAETTGVMKLLPKRNFNDIPPETVHCVRTCKYGGFNILRMNPYGIKDHIYVDEEREFAERECSSLAKPQQITNLK